MAKRRKVQTSGPQLRRRDRELLEAFGIENANVTVIRGRPRHFGLVANFTLIDGRSTRPNVTIITD